MGEWKGEELEVNKEHQYGLFDSGQVILRPGLSAYLKLVCPLTANES